MSVARIAAIIVIYLAACGGWMILGTATALRSDSAWSSLGDRVEGGWGGPLDQSAPAFTGAGGARLVPTDLRGQA